MKTIITTDRKCKPESIQLAKSVSVRLGISLVEREKLSIDELRERYEAQAVLVVKQGELHLYTDEGELFFHPNMSHLRVKNLRLGQQDHMTEAMQLQPGMSVLDCTLGFGTDAIVASYGVGETGQVVGLEVSPWIAAVTGHGLQHFLANNYELHGAMRRIKVVNMDYLSFLQQQEADSFDVVYFDPMFRKPLRSSSNFNPLRGVADHGALSQEAVQEACRVARQRVVMKECSFSSEFQRLGFTKVMGGKWAKVHYGVMELGQV